MADSERLALREIDAGPPLCGCGREMTPVRGSGNRVVRWMCGACRTTKENV